MNTLRRFVFLGTTICYGAAATFGSGLDSALETTEVVRRRALSSNTPSAVYSELRDPILVKELIQLKISKVIDAPVSVVCGGNDDQITISVHFLPPIPSDPEGIAQNIVAYARLRWLGLSKDAALELMRLRIHPARPDNAQAGALHRAMPWLPFEKLRPLLPGESVAIFWAVDGTAFVFEDTDISFVILFEKYGGRIEAMTYAVDSREFARGTSAEIAVVAKNAWAEVRLKYGDRRPPSAILFWRELKDILKRRGIAWMSPEDLNPEIDWH